MIIFTIYFVRKSKMIYGTRSFPRIELVSFYFSRTKKTTMTPRARFLSPKTKRTRRVAHEKTDRFNASRSRVAVRLDREMTISAAVRVDPRRYLNFRGDTHITRRCLAYFQFYTSTTITARPLVECRPNVV